MMLPLKRIWVEKKQAVISPKKIEKGKNNKAIFPLITGLKQDRKVEKIIN